eukprot:1697012-Amphidinium_carterae.1
MLGGSVFGTLGLGRGGARSSAWDRVQAIAIQGQLDRFDPRVQFLCVSSPRLNARSGDVKGVKQMAAVQEASGVPCRDGLYLAHYLAYLPQSIQ